MGGNKKGHGVVTTPHRHRGIPLREETSHPPPPATLDSHSINVGRIRTRSVISASLLDPPRRRSRSTVSTEGHLPLLALFSRHWTTDNSFSTLDLGSIDIPRGPSLYTKVFVQSEILKFWNFTILLSRLQRLPPMFQLLAVSNTVYMESTIISLHVNISRSNCTLLAMVWNLKSGVGDRSEG